MRQVVTVVPIENLSRSDREAILRLCVAALGAGATSLFDYVSGSTHVVAYIGPRLVGHACWTTRWLEPTGIRPLRTAWVDAVAVDPPLHNQGIGTIVMGQVAGAITGYELGGLGTERISFYERVGWEVWRGSTEGVLQDPLDSLLILRTPASPPLDLAGSITVQ